AHLFLHLPAAIFGVSAGFLNAFPDGLTRFISGAWSIKYAGHDAKGEPGKEPCKAVPTLLSIECHKYLLETDVWRVHPFASRRTPNCANSQGLLAFLVYPDEKGAATCSDALRRSRVRASPDGLGVFALHLIDPRDVAESRKMRCMANFKNVGPF